MGFLYTLLHPYLEKLGSCDGKSLLSNIMFVSTAFMSPSITNSSERESAHHHKLKRDEQQKALPSYLALDIWPISNVRRKRERKKSCLSIYLSELIFDRRSNITVGVKKAIAPQHVYHHCCMVFENHSKSLNLQQYNPFW